MEDFSPEELNNLLQAALAEGHTGSPPELSPGAALVSFCDTHIFASLHSVLSKWIPAPEEAMILAELRDSLYADIKSSSIHELHTIMKNVKCDGEVQLPFWNVLDPDVMFVSENPPYGEEGELVTSCLQQAGFSSRHCVWSSWNRVPHLEEGVKKFAPFLYHEIRIWRPKLIVCFGGGAATPFLTSQKITDTHGVVHWLGPWAIMPVFSPMWASKSGRLDGLISDLSQAHTFAFG